MALEFKAKIRKPTFEFGCELFLELYLELFFRVLLPESSIFILMKTTGNA